MIRSAACKKRYNLIDMLRGIAIANMIAFHFCYDFFKIYRVCSEWTSLPWVFIWERFICCTFIILSGISLNFSGKPIFRGIVVNICGFFITAVTLIFVPRFPVWCGILNLIGTSMIVFGLLGKPLQKINSTVGAVVSFLLFMLTYGIQFGYIGIFDIQLIPLPRILYSSNALVFFGFFPKDFFSVDYFPIFPWLFLFLFGMFLWRIIKENGQDTYFKKGSGIFCFLGRHSLIIYLIHQPAVMLAACLLAQMFNTY